MAVKRWTRVTAWEDVDLVLDVDGLMALLRISQTTALALLNSREIPAQKAGKGWRINKDNVRRWLDGKSKEEVA